MKFFGGSLNTCAFWIIVEDSSLDCSYIDYFYSPGGGTVEVLRSLIASCFECFNILSGCYLEAEWETVC